MVLFENWYKDNKLTFITLNCFEELNIPSVSLQFELCKLQFPQKLSIKADSDVASK